MNEMNYFILLLFYSFFVQMLMWKTPSSFQTSAHIVSTRCLSCHIYEAFSAIMSFSSLLKALLSGTVYSICPNM